MCVELAFTIYQVYVIPILVYCLETLPLIDTPVDQLKEFHISMLKKLQLLPEQTVSTAAQLLLSALPVQAEIQEAVKLALCYYIILKLIDKESDGPIIDTADLYYFLLSYVQPSKAFSYKVLLE